MNKSSFCFLFLIVSLLSVSCASATVSVSNTTHVITITDNTVQNVSELYLAIVEKYGATVYSSVEELLSKSDAVSVCVPTPFHKNVVGQVFSARKSVLIEKPICATADEATQLMQGAPEGITIGVGHIERLSLIHI